MGVLYNRLLILLNETPADSTFYHIALCMLQDFEQLVRTSIAEVADLCHVSKSTISKFIRAMGYEDFASFRYAAEVESLHYRPEHTVQLSEDLIFQRDRGAGQPRQAGFYPAGARTNA